MSFIGKYTKGGASLVAQILNSLPAMQETQVRFPRLGRSPGEGNSTPLQYYYCLENSMDRGAGRAIVHGVAKRTLSFVFTQRNNGKSPSVPDLARGFSTL